MARGKRLVAGQGVLWLAGLALLLLAPAWVRAAGDQALEVLRKSVLARGEVSYSGVATVTDCDRGGTRSYTQTVVRRKGGAERIKLQDAGGRVVWVRVSDGRQVWEHDLRGGHLYVRPLGDPAALRRNEMFNLEVLGRNFDVVLLAPESVAGRRAQHVRIQHPGPPKVFVRDVWVDEGTHIELKTARYSSENQLTHVVAMTKVNFAPTFTADLFTYRPPPAAKVETIQAPLFSGPLQAAADKAGFPALPPKRVPKGFLLYRDSVGVREFGGAPVLWFQHTDGVRTFSVFQRKAAAAARRGLQSTNVLRVGDYQITIVGPLTPEELTTIKAGYLSPGR